MSQQSKQQRKNNRNHKPKTNRKSFRRQQMTTKFKPLQENLGVHFTNEKLLIQAFTHSSYVNEHRRRPNEDNERLEFLGDAVLELIISQYLYKKFENMSEGDLTKLRASIVCEPSLVKFANHFSFGEYVLLGKGEENTGGRERPALLADVFEAFIGALYLDKGLDVVEKFLEKHVYPQINEGSFSPISDFKSQLQEFLQRKNHGQIHYEIVEEKGPAHNREFTSVVISNGNQLGQGVGKSKKEAEQRAAQEALRKLKNK